MDAICQHASGLLAGRYRQLRDWICAQDALHVEKTGWRTAGDSRALWTMSTAGASIFEIAEHCNREQFDELIGPFAGIILTAERSGEATPAVTSRGSAFVGRERELAELAGGLDDAFAGRGRLLLSGEPGIGKSRLADELSAHATARGAHVLVGRSWEAGGAPAYWPWVHLQELRDATTARPT